VPFNRRTILKFGLGGAAVLTVGGVGLGLRGTAMRAAPQALRVLSTRQYSILAAIAETLCPGGPGLPDANEVQVAVKVDGVLDTLHPGDAKEFVQALALMENALVGLAFQGRFSTFSGSSPAVRTAALEGWRTSGLALRRTAFTAVSGLCMGAYWSDPSTYAHVGYPGPPPLGAAAPGRKRGG